MAFHFGCRREYKSKFPENFIITPGKRQYPNPGNIANLHKKTRDITPEFFDGCQLTFKKSLAPNKTLLTNWILSHVYPTGFRIGGMYHWKQYGNIMETPIIEADINPSTLSSNFSMVYFPWPSIKFDARLQRLERFKLADSLLSLEYMGKSSTYNLSVYNPSHETGRLTLSYLGCITKHLSLGSELLFEWCGKNLQTKTALAAKYAKEKYNMAATVSLEALDMSYWRQIHKGIQLGSSFVFNSRNQKAIGSVCYQWEFQDAFVRGMVDSDLSVGFMYNRKISQLPCILKLSLLFCIPNNRCSFGLTIEIDPSSRCQV